MDPPDAPDDNPRVRDDDDVVGELELEGAAAADDDDAGGEVELRPLVSSPVAPRPRRGPTDPDGDVLAPVPHRPPRRAAPPPAPAPAPGSAATNVAFAKPNAAEGSAGERAAFLLSNEGIVDGLNRLRVAARGVQSRAEARAEAAMASRGGADASPPPGASPGPGDGKKKALLLLLSTLFVALLGAVLSKGAAVGAERDVEGGETAAAFHVHSHVGHSDQQVKIHVINVTGYEVHTLVNASDYLLPGTEDAPPLSAAKGRPYTPVLNHFQFRCPTCDYADHWGYFDFEDPDPNWRGRMRPQPAFANHPNRDVPNAEFPEDAWQRSDDYMEAFLREAKRLVNRSIEAVHAEYGVGLPPGGKPPDDAPPEWWENRRQFAPLLVKETVGQGGGGSWTTRASMDRTARRFIHHITTGDTFKLVLGGHSAAAGHGAGFNQSYIIEAGHVLEPVFAHLGVEARAYNFAQGGMGTFQQSLAGMDLRSKEADWIMWDSKMTERPAYLADFFFRQAIVSGNRSPVLMAEGYSLPTAYHDQAGASVAHQGNGWVPVTVSDEQAKDVPWAAQWLQCARDGTANCKGHEYTAGCWVEREDFKPQAAQAGIVGGQASWHPGNRIHKRRGRMIALIILQTLDYALDRWAELAEEGGGYPIAEEHWHVTDYYKDIREKIKEVGGCYGNNWGIGQKRRLAEGDADGPDAPGGTDPRRLDIEGFWPSRLCNLPLQGRSLWGPRHNPMESSLVSIMKPNIFGDVDPAIKTNGYMQGPCYEPPDRPAPWTVPPKTEPFAPLIGWNRRLDEGEEESRHRQLRSELDGHPNNGRAAAAVPVAEEGQKVPILRHNTNTTRVLEDGDAAERGANDKLGITDNDEITPGLGLSVNWGREGVCDGSSHSWCDKTCGSACLMGGAQDNRGMVCFDGLSGWLVLDVKNVKHGFIGARMESWRKASDVSTTVGWTAVNNGGRGNYDKRGRERRLHEEYQRRANAKFVERMDAEIEEDIKFFAEGRDPSDAARRLGGGQSCGIGGDFTFQWAINGEIKATWNQAQFCQHYTRLNYNLDVIKFMDDEEKTGDFELAMRITNGGRGKVMCLTHLYWA